MVNDIKEFAQLGILSLKSGNFQKAISVSPFHAESYNNIGVVYIEKNIFGLWENGSKGR